MIKKITIDGVHGVKATIDFGKRTKLKGISKIGKTTVLNSIMACYSSYYPGYGKGLPDGNINLVTDSGESIINNKRLITALELDPSKLDLIRYIVPGNFFRLTSGTPEQRKILTKLLGLDIDLLESYTNDIKFVKEKIKEFDKTKDQITLDIIRYQDELDNLGEIIVPLKPNVIKDNSEDILKAYDQLIESINKENRKDQAEYNLLIEDYNTELKTAELFRLDEVRQLGNSINLKKNKLIELTNKGKLLQSQVEYNCKECGTLIKPTDNSQEINDLRKEYSDITLELQTLESDLNKIHNQRTLNISKVTRPIQKKLKDLPSVYSLLDKSIVVGIKYKEGNTIELNEYNNKYNDFIALNSKKESLEKELEYKANQLKELNPTALELSLKKLEKQKADFNSNTEKKVKDTGLDIRLFEVLKNGNIKETFNIFDEEGYDYYATSTGNQLYIEILLAKLFVNYLGLDFILVDRWESIGVNLRDKIYNIIGDLQLIVTEVTPDEDITVENF